MDSIADLLAEHNGTSAYFSTPATFLDPNLFAGSRVIRQVRVLLLNTFYSYMRTRWSGALSWSTVYLAGSGASYQWAADRSNGDEPGDLDVLVEIDWPLFYAHQGEDLRGFTPQEVAAFMDNGLKAQLWPQTAEMHIGRGTYEVTFYVNAQPITSIRPYAAYNLSEDKWLVPPDPHPPHPQGTADYQAVMADRAMVDKLLQHYNDARYLLGSHPVGSPEWVNANADLTWVAKRAAQLFEEIHSARSIAFSEQGNGYSDDANFRWQAAKQQGIINDLMGMAAGRPRPSDEDINTFLINRALQARRP